MTFVNIGLGWFLGFTLGVGCSLAVMYSVYMGGYRKAISDSLEEPQGEGYRAGLAKAKARRAIA